jgi:putative ABC transport system permease protein
MLKNYLKITLAVMKRRKFYTFISLFGISMTLTMLIVLTSFIDQLLEPNYPEVHRNRSLYVQRVQIIDTKNGGSSMNPLSRYFIETYLKTMPTPEKVSMASQPDPINTYLNGQKGKVFIKYTDAEFWQISQFSFLEGKEFSNETIKNGDKSVIISDLTRDQYFGKDLSVVGKSLELNDDVFRIVGVVKNCPITQVYVGADIYLPHTFDKFPQKTGDLGGKYFATILAKSKTDMPIIQQEFLAMLPKIPLGNEKDVDKKKIGKSDRSGDDFSPDSLVMQAQTYTESFTDNLTGTGGNDSGKTLFFTVLGIFAFLFMLLPALNLINVNISRIMERASEIGIRKAFGASAGTLTVQFVIENVILTVIGGIIAVVFSAFVIFYLNRVGIGPLKTLSLSINWVVVFTTFLLCLIFGLMSGVYPAWRMSKLSVVDALRQ